MGQYLSHSSIRFAECEARRSQPIKPEVSTSERNIVIAEVSLVMLAIIVFIIFI